MNNDKPEFGFEHLVGLFEQTQSTLQRQAGRAVNTALVIRNWLFGWYIIEYQQRGSDRAQYGSKLLKILSAQLKTKLGKGFSVDSLELMRNFYMTYQKIPFEKGKSETLSRISGLISETASRKLMSKSGKTAKPQVLAENILKIGQTLSDLFPLSWSHYVCLITIRNEEERAFYEIEAINENWSLRELKRQIDSSLYERLALSRDKDEVRKLARQGQSISQPKDAVKDPYILEFLGLTEQSKYSESDLESAIIDKLEHFLLELGKGFLFEARQKRFTFDEDHYFVDLVFYNRLLRCYTLIDLKIGELTHQDLGQMQMYVNYFDRYLKLEDESPTIGIIVCKKKKDSLVEITLPEKSNIHASEYQLYLPSKEELRKQLEEAQQDWEARHETEI